MGVEISHPNLIRSLGIEGLTLKNKNHKTFHPPQISLHYVFINLEKIKICNEGGIDEARLKLFPKRGKNL